LSLGDSPRGGEADGEETTQLVFLLLKTCPSPELSSSEGTTKTPLPLSRGAGAGVQAAARGTAAMGGGELVVWRLCGESVVVAVFRELGLWGASEGASRAPTFPAIALLILFSFLANAKRLDESITEATPQQTKSKGQN